MSFRSADSVSCPRLCVYVFVCNEAWARSKQASTRAAFLYTKMNKLYLQIRMFSFFLLSTVLFSSFRVREVRKRMSVYRICVCLCVCMLARGNACTKPPYHYIHTCMLYIIRPKSKMTLSKQADRQAGMHACPL